MRNVEYTSWLYSFMRLYGWLIHRITHRHITVIGLDNIPNNKPVIFAANHQNAVMDSLAMVFSKFKQTVFLGRADIFKNKFAAKFLHFYKVTPVYRIRDGKDSLGKNEEVFNTCVRILKANKRLCVYPEAMHVGQKSMVAHKKAIPRIVFIAGEKTNYDIDIQVVPVGISYTHYYNFKRSQTIVYGKPISAKKYYKVLDEVGEFKAANIFRKDLFEEVKKLVVHVPDKAKYDLYEQAFEIFRPCHYPKLGLKKSEKLFLKAEQKLTSKIGDWVINNQEQSEEHLEKAKQYGQLKSELKFSETELEKGQIGLVEILAKIALSIVLFPFSIYGALTNGWLFYLTRYPYRKGIKDKQFYSSISFGLSLFLYPLWLIIHLFLVNVFVDNLLWSFALVVLSIPSAIIGWHLGQLLKKMKNRIRFNKLTSLRNEKFNDLINLRKDLLALYIEILNNK